VLGALACGDVLVLGLADWPQMRGDKSRLAVVASVGQEVEQTADLWDDLAAKYLSWCIPTRVESQRHGLPRDTIKIQGNYLLI